MIEELTSLEDERLDVFLRLTEVQLRNKLEPEKGIFIAESAKVVSRALDAGYDPIAALMPFNKLGSHAALIERLEFAHPGITVFTAPDSLIQQLTGYELTRGVLVAFRRKVLPAVGDVIAGARRVAILEDITNHTNIGALFRSAAALGVDAIILNRGCCDPLYRRAIRVSMGTVFRYLGRALTVLMPLLALLHLCCKKKQWQKRKAMSMQHENGLHRPCVN